MVVIGRELIVPFDLAAVRIDRQHAVAVEIVALAAFGIVVGGGVAGAPDQQMLFGIVAAGEPGGGPAGLPAIAGPGLIALLAGAGCCVGAPQPFAGRRVIGVKITSDAQLAA